MHSPKTHVPWSEQSLGLHAGGEAQSGPLQPSLHWHVADRSMQSPRPLQLFSATQPSSKVMSGDASDGKRLIGLRHYLQQRAHLAEHLAQRFAPDRRARADGQ